MLRKWLLSPKPPSVWKSAVNIWFKKGDKQKLLEKTKSALKRIYHKTQSVPIVGAIARHFVSVIRGVRRPSLSERLLEIQHRLESLETRFNNEVVQALNLQEQIQLIRKTMKYSGLLAPNDHANDDLYFQFENVFRGPREMIKDRQRVYLHYIEAVNAGTEESPIVDLGCGRGEWLQLLSAQSKVAVGVDSNVRMVAECRKIGLNVIEENVIEFLERHESESVGAVTAFHLIEHLPFAILIQFFRECLRILKPGGIGIFETPNPENILVGSNYFYTDLSHLRPLKPNSIQFWLKSLGWSEAELLYLHPPEDDFCSEEASTYDMDTVKTHFCCAQDYALIARKT